MTGHTHTHAPRIRTSGQTAEYNLTFQTSGETKTFSLSISGQTVITNQSTLPTRPSLETLFVEKGYGVEMPGLHKICKCEKAPGQAAFKIFKDLVAAGIKR